MISAGDFRNGLCFEMDDQVYQVVEFQHVKPGKGAAFVRTKYKNVKTGSVVEREGIVLVNQERAAAGYPQYLDAAQLPKDLKGFPYRIVKGRAPSPNAPDEICISSNYIGVCNVGDTLVLNRPRENDKEYRFKVSGFFDINSRALFGDSYVCQIDSSRGAYASAFTYGDVLPEDVTGNRDIMIIHPAAGYTVSDIKPQVLKVAGRGTAYTYEEYRDKLYDADSDNAVVFKAIAIATAIVTLELLIAYTLIQLSLRKNELVIYYLTTPAQISRTEGEI